MPEIGGDILKVGFIGAGKVGVSLGKYFSEHGITVTGFYSRQLSSSKEAAEFTNSKSFIALEPLITESRIIIITTPDDSISEIWQKINKFNLKDKIICHTSGSLSSEIFSNINNSGAFGYSIHPMFAFSDKFNSYKNLKDAYFSIEGDAKYLNEVKLLIEALGNTVLVINKEIKPLYHLSNVTVSNLVLSLLNIGCSYLSQCGINEEIALKALMPLIENNIQNLKVKGFVSSLTGPIERGDLGTIKKHVGILSNNDIELYKTLSLNLINLSEKKHAERDYSKLKDFLGGV
jgi:predicted short-subunit dehydrogenase-like oxidoreductase (DUF2520 family)